jgi:hypothetical protein
MSEPTGGWVKAVENLGEAACETVRAGRSLGGSMASAFRPLIANMIPRYEAPERVTGQDQVLSDVRPDAVACRFPADSWRKRYVSRVLGDPSACSSLPCCPPPAPPLLQRELHFIAISPADSVIVATPLPRVNWTFMAVLPPSALAALLFPSGDSAMRSRYAYDLWCG